MSNGSNYCTVRIDTSKCDFCMECVNTCTTGALTYEDTVCFCHNSQECAYCEVCIDVCEKNAITILGDV